MKRIGIIVNPASGKDIRRLAAKASVFDNREKEAIVRRAVAGAMGAGATAFAYMDDSHQIAASAFSDVQGIDAQPVPCPKSATSVDTREAAYLMQSMDVAAILVLGGDGTNRAVVTGWRDATLLPLSTGTNNVFPVLGEATVAGAALGLVASGKVRAGSVAPRTKIIDLDLEDEDPDIALIDAVLTSDVFIGARALLDIQALELAVLARAEPAAVGITSLGGLLRQVSSEDDRGLFLQFGEEGTAYSAPLAPGRFETLTVEKVSTLKLGDTVTAEGPGVLAFDGERERTLKPGQRVTFSVSRTGPRVIDIERTMAIAARRGLFKSGALAR